MFMEGIYNINMGYRFVSVILLGVETFFTCFRGELISRFFGEVKSFPLNLGGLLKKLPKKGQKIGQKCPSEGGQLHFGKPQWWV